MAKTLNFIGDTLDRVDAAGWLLLVCGVAVIAITVLIPPWLSEKQLESQAQALYRQACLDEILLTNSQAFVRALERGDPLLMQRLAYHHLNLKPIGAEVIFDSALQTDQPVPSMDQWVRPTLAPIHVNAEKYTLPDTRLVRLITGASRPWVLAMGGWLVLMGLLMNPKYEIELDEDGASML
ncbi:MAG: hypothetical protein ACYTGQ_19290 [Planctomycetota bacterium]|jgi:hypothetical protein